MLVASALVAGAALAVTAMLPAGAPLPALLAATAVLGFATPPVPACLRALLPALVREPEALRKAYAVDSAAVELTWISGPPLVLLAGALTSTGLALILAGAALAVATLAFAAAPASRGWRPPAPATRTAQSALVSPGIKTLALVLAGAGLLFGTTEVAVTAAADAAAAGPLLGLWGVGSFVGGIVAARAGGGARTGAGLAVLFAALAAGHMALAAGVGSTVALGAGLVAAGTMIAPTCATAYAMVEAAAPVGTVTEAFAWMTTSAALGTSAGAAAAGRDHRGRRPRGRAADRGHRRAGRRRRRRRPRPHPDRRRARDRVMMDTVTIWWDLHGEGEPLVLLHPGGADSRAFDVNLEGLSAAFRTYRYDRRGQGRTPDPGGPITFADMTDEAIAFIEEVVGEPVHLLGHSVGAPLVLLVALSARTSSAGWCSPRACSTSTGGCPACWTRCRRTCSSSSAASTPRCRRTAPRTGSRCGRGSTTSTTSPPRSPPPTSRRSPRRRC